jgi:putative FmdB family regulatory protein
MPTYDFKCDECGHTFERRVAFDELVYCDDCDKTATKLFSPTTALAIFKGDGWAGKS